MKLRFLAPIFAMTMVGACSNELSNTTETPKEDSIPINTLNAEQEFEPTPAQNVIEKSFDERLDEIWVDNTLTKEEKEEKYKALKFPQLFSREYERECLVKTTTAINHNKKNGTYDPNLQEAQGYYSMRISMEDGDMAVIDYTVAWTIAIQRECNGNPGCELDQYDLAAAAAPACVSTYLEYKPR